jgi:hypothetical protein
LTPTGQEMAIANTEIINVMHSGNQTDPLLLAKSNLVPKILPPYALKPGIDLITIKIISKKNINAKIHESNDEKNLDALSAPCFLTIKLLFLAMVISL